MKSPAHYCFVTPRFGAEIVGGAETLVRELALRLAARGDRVRVLSTCAIDNRTWENALPPGEFSDGKLKGERFLVGERDLDSWIPKQIAVSQGIKLSLKEELEWMQHSVNAPELYRYLEQHASEFDCIFFAPYLFGTTFWGSLIAPHKSCLIPCLHDEYYAYTQVVEAMFRRVGRALFNAVPEQELATALYGQILGGEVGMGFEPPKPTSVNSPITGRYIVCLGRKELGKNAQLVIDYFIDGKTSGVIPADLKLVIAGGGSFSDLGRDASLTRGDVIDLQRVSEEQKQALLRDALLLIQPSVNESFSIVLMEGWQQSVPALVNAHCAVTKHHVIRSGGGLYFQNAAEFCRIIKELAESAQLRTQLGDAGKRYVEERYNWDAVLERFDGVMKLFQAHAVSAADERGMQNA